MYKSTTNNLICSIFVQAGIGIYMIKNSKYITSAEIEQQGRAAYYKMLEKVRQGELIQVRRGVYAHAEQMSAGMIDIDSVVPEGILCLWSSWSIHRLTTSMPQAFHIAVKRGRKVPVLAIPQVEIHYYSDALLNIGVTETTVDGFSIRLYDVERCVCDAVKFRNKVGMDVCSEIINNYLERPDRNLSRLMDYARLLRVGAILEKYLQVKL